MNAWRLTGLHAVVCLTEDEAFPEADEESLEIARIYFEKGRRLMASI